MNIYWEKIRELVVSLDNETKAAIRSVSSIKSIRKGDYLLREGEICKESYLIEDGAARKFYLIDGKEITTEIYFTYDMAISMQSYCLRQPSKESIQAITDVKALQTDHDAFEKLKANYPHLHEFDLQLNEHYVMWLEERLYQLYTLSATERYKKLLESYPVVIHHIPLTYIASYLGISLETLSRIRARI